MEKRGLFHQLPITHSIVLRALTLSPTATEPFSLLFAYHGKCVGKVTSHFAPSSAAPHHYTSPSCSCWVPPWSVCHTGSASDE